MLKRNALNVSKTSTEQTFSFFFVKILKNKNCSMHYSLVILSSWVKFAWNLLPFLTKMSFNYKRRLFFVVSFTSNIIMKTIKNFVFYVNYVFSPRDISNFCYSVHRSRYWKYKSLHKSKLFLKNWRHIFFQPLFFKMYMGVKGLHGRFF